MTKQERSDVLELARKLCLDVERQQLVTANAQKRFGFNTPFVQAMATADGAKLCAEAIEEAKEEA